MWCAKVRSWELGLSRVLRPDDHRNHSELRHVSSLHYRLRHQSCQILTDTAEIRAVAEKASRDLANRWQELDMVWKIEWKLLMTTFTNRSLSYIFYLHVLYINNGLFYGTTFRSIEYIRWFCSKFQLHPYGQFSRKCTRQAIKCFMKLS